MRWRVPLALMFAACALGARAQDGPAYQADAQAFVVVPGERALVMGYPQGLEVWAYPLQLLSDWRVRFHVPGQVQRLDGQALLRRTEHHADETVRVYIGPDFVVRERLFVPRQESAAIIRFEVEGRPDVRIEASFQPVLDLMWPGAIGGQNAGWDAARGGYVLREPLERFAAAITSPETVGHDDTLNRTRPLARGLSLLLQPRGTAGAARVATVYIAREQPGTPAGAGFAAREAALRADVRAHGEAVAAGSIRITTPNAGINRALASATLALDDAWVCSDALGCGAVAGYGPSRPGRRPQYAWFFAGDGLVAMQAMLDSGQHARARAEMAFITRYQNRANGMIWHEMSQSAPWLNWERDYPYMFVHVDISFQYLVGFEHYITATGDTALLNQHWRNLAAAWAYCRSLIARDTGLPQIPPGKQGQNEQERLRDDIRLSTLWVDAADSYAQLARLAGHSAEARAADDAAARARAAIAAQGWDAPRGFWLSGHRLDGAPVHSERPDASGVLLQRVFAPARVEAVLDRLSAPEFATDWGVRSLSVAAPDYDPNLYGSGSVWALGTADVATTLWKSHRPLAAYGLWRALARWDTLDSPGHLHEVLAGDLYHPEFESVPAQTWSSAALISSAVHGLLGLEIHATERQLTFAPHLPADWATLAVREVPVARTRVGFSLARDADGFTILIETRGEAVRVDLAPALPPGARLGTATADGAPTPVRPETTAQDDHARLTLLAQPGTTRVRIAFTDAVDIAVPAPPPEIGAPSRALKPVSARFTDGKLHLDAWVLAADQATLLITTRRTPSGAQGARIEPLGGGRHAVHFDAKPGGAPVHAHAVIAFR